MDREHQLRTEMEQGQIDPEIERRELGRLDVAPDQCWDLLRQRQARRHASLDEEDAFIRSASQVESYLTVGRSQFGRGAPPELP